MYPPLLLSQPRAGRFGLTAGDFTDSHPKITIGRSVKDREMPFLSLRGNLANYRHIFLPFLQPVDEVTVVYILSKGKLVDLVLSSAPDTQE